MPVIVCMLRGVNVGGHNQIKMDTLRALCTSLKLRGSQTLLQSGNVVFRTEEKDLARLSKRIAKATRNSSGASSASPSPAPHRSILFLNQEFHPWIGSRSAQNDNLPPPYSETSTRRALRVCSGTMSNSVERWRSRST